MDHSFPSFMGLFTGPEGFTKPIGGRMSKILDIQTTQHPKAESLSREVGHHCRRLPKDRQMMEQQPCIVVSSSTGLTLTCGII